LAIPDATLEHLGIGGVAAASSARYRTVLSERWVPAALRRSSSRAAELADELLDYSYLDEYMRSWESIDLLAQSPHLTLPTLYIEWPPHLTQFPEGEPAQLFLQFVPDAQVRRSTLWGVGDPANLANPEAGEELAAFISDFLAGLAARNRLLTVLFTDIVDSTVHALELGDQRWARVLADHHALVRRELAAHGGHEVDNAGDGFLATFESPARAVRCAAAISEGVRALGIEVRAGVHIGECEVVGDKVGGVAVHAGARIAATAGPGEVLVSQPVRDLAAGSDLHFESARTVTLKGTARRVAALPPDPLVGAYCIRPILTP
jgi:class 3 adenylate cyclase